MAITDARLSIIAFPQRWDGARISYRALVLPKGNPQSPLLAGAPAFAGAAVRVRARVIPGLDKLPAAADALAPASGAQALETPDNAADVFDALQEAFSIDPLLTGNPHPPVTFKKYLTRSYRGAFAFEGPSRPYLYTGDAYECALKDPALTERPPKPAPTGVLSWGQALAFALRQPVLAEALGLLFKGSVPIDAPEDFDAGGWLYVELAPSSAFAAETAAAPGSLALFAARLPPLTDARALFAGVVFPLGATGPFDEQFVEAESYDDGFAKVVHGAQAESGAIVETQARPAPVVKDLGLHLGWDDEQLAVWMNRQIDAASIAPMGVAGYRVDVKNGDGAWTSLTRARGNVSIGELQLGVFDDELTVEVAPVQLAAQTVGDYWLPSYFTTWRGESIVLRGETALRLARRDEEELAARPFTVPNLAEIPDLRYGHDYQFRVRLVDLSRGGPELEDSPKNPAPSPETTIKFRRYCPPKAVRLEPHPSQVDDEPVTHVRVLRPLLGYPDAVFAGADDAEAALIDDIETAGLTEREAGVPDPDVDQLHITVEVRQPELSAGRGEGGYVPIYTTTRAFDGDPGEPLDLTIAHVDHPTLTALEAADPLNPVAAVGAIEVPTARDVRLRLTAVCKEDDDLEYFGTQTARQSLSPASVLLRAASRDERDLFVPDAATDQLRALMMRPDAAPGANHAATRMADRLELQVSDLTFTGRRGRRTVFGCSGSLRHTLAPDRSTITFASSSDLIRQWVVAIRVSLARDWSWDALAPVSFEVERDGQIVGSIDMPTVVSALAGGDRNQTDLVFFHAIDPKSRPGQFPAEIHTRFSVRPLFREAPAMSDGPLSWQLRLPVATPPAQTPKLVSAGIALSPYDVLPEYSRSPIRERMLWLEFEEPPLDPQDRYVCRVLAYAPDPALMHEAVTIPAPAEPPLPIDQELIRVITSGQSNDDAGAHAMQPLLSAPEGSAGASAPGGSNVVTFLLPRPDGVSASSAELFGFWVYELRLAHAGDRWSLAQARYGARLRVTGVQHPAPVLSCHVAQTPDGVLVDVPYATPVFEGRNVRPRTPKTEIWALLYAQGMQIDGETRRNVLIVRGRGEPTTMPPRQDQLHGDDLLLMAAVRFPRQTVRERLTNLGLPVSAPLSVLAVELLPQPLPEVRYPDPLGGDLGQVRILRASPLQPVPAIC